MHTLVTYCTISSIYLKPHSTFDPSAPPVNTFQAALEAIRSENEACLLEHAAIVGRMEAVSREYDDMRLRAAEAEAELSR